MIPPKPIRVRSPRHLARLRTLACTIPGCADFSVIQVHHVTFAQAKARGLKSGDQWSLPLCRAHHDARSSIGVHHVGDERSWWKDLGIDPLPIAARLWAETEK